MSTYIVSLHILLAGVLAIAIGGAVWLAIQTKRLPLALGLFCVLPVSQIFMLHSLSSDGWAVSWLLGLLLGLAAIVALLVYTALQERMAARWAKTQETHRQIELERSYHAAEEQRQKDLAKIRREFGGIIEGIVGLTASGKEAGVNDGISALAEHMKQAKGHTYCTIPVINAVLAQKESDCRQAGIALAVDLHLPDTLGVKPMHMCSILVNMLDNAIAACEKMPDGNKPQIRLASVIDGDYLLVKVTNPANKPPKRNTTRHHYGLQILTELAREYGGDFQGSWREGVYTAIMSLLVR